MLDDIITIIMIVLVSISLLITNVYILAYFSHPDDKGSCRGWLLKIIVIIGLTLAWCQDLMLPLDVSNNRTFGGNLNMKILWYITFISTIVYVMIIFPISSSLYEADEEWTFCEKFRHSLCCFFITLFFFVTMTVILYITIGTVELPINSISCNFNKIENSSEPIFDNSTFFDNITNFCEINTESQIELDVNPVIYSIGILSFVSWIVFAVFGGIGLAAVPLDFFYSFCTRPKSMQSKDIKKRRNILIKEVKDLRNLGNEILNLEESGANRSCICSSRRRKYSRYLHEFTVRYALAEDEFHIVNASKETMLKNNCVVICYYLLLPFGFITSILTILWLLQFSFTYFWITENNRAGYPFLSYIFIYFQDHDVSFLSFFLFAIMSLYLLLCTIKGNFKFGVRILCCGTIHPMKKDKTYMNSFLFNVTLILLGSCAITQFCADCLSDYVAFTDIDTLFNVYIRNLKYLGDIFRLHIFQYIFIGFFVVSFIVLICRPADRVEPMGYKKIGDEKEMQLLNKKKHKHRDD